MPANYSCTWPTTRTRAPSPNKWAFWGVRRGTCGIRCKLQGVGLSSLDGRPLRSVPRAQNACMHSTIELAPTTAPYLAVIAYVRLQLLLDRGNVQFPGLLAHGQGAEHGQWVLEHRGRAAHRRVVGCHREIIVTKRSHVLSSVESDQDNSNGFQGQVAL